MNKIKKLNNRYFIIRHGESKANITHILLSHPKEGTVSFGLSLKGKKQVRLSVAKSKKDKILDSDVMIYSSDFLTFFTSLISFLLSFASFPFLSSIFLAVMSSPATT